MDRVKEKRAQPTIVNDAAVKNWKSIGADERFHRTLEEEV
jgi:hypothetical protein